MCGNNGISGAAIVLLLFILFAVYFSVFVFVVSDKTLFQLTPL